MTLCFSQTHTRNSVRRILMEMESLQILCSSGNQNDVGFGVGQVPCGVSNARGNMSVCPECAGDQERSRWAKKIGNLLSMSELYIMTNRANFGNNYNPNAFVPATYNTPNAFIGGIGSVSTIPNSFPDASGGTVYVLTKRQLPARGATIVKLTGVMYNGPGTVLFSVRCLLCGSFEGG